MAFGGGAVGSTGAVQAWDYVFTGAEGSHFVVALPSPRADANYGVAFGPQTDPDTFGFSYDTKTTTNFKLRTSAQVPAGRKVTLTLYPLTA